MLVLRLLLLGIFGDIPRVKAGMDGSCESTAVQLPPQLPNPHLPKRLQNR